MAPPAGGAGRGGPGRRRSSSALTNGPPPTDAVYGSCLPPLRPNIGLEEAPGPGGQGRWLQDAPGGLRHQPEPGDWPEGDAGDG